MPNSQWDFIKNSEGTIFLVAIAEQGFVPLMGFMTPEAFSHFVIDTNNAYKLYVPKAMRDSLEVLNHSNWGKLSDDGT